MASAVALAIVGAILFGTGLFALLRGHREVRIIGATMAFAGLASCALAVLPVR